MDIQEDETKKIYEILDNIHPAVINRKLDKIIDLIKSMHEVENKDLLRKCYNDRGVDLITLTCKYNKINHLNYLLHQSHILHYLTSDSTEMKCKEDAFYYAMRSNHLEVLEVLYDYWSGDLHWLGHKKEYNKFDIQNLEQLNDLLNNAFAKYEEYVEIKKKVDPQQMFNIQSLLAFNCFQRDLYSKLNELKDSLIPWEDKPEDIIRIQETYAIKRMILAMFEIHEKHCKKGENMIKKSVFEIKNDILEDLADASTLLQRARLYVVYEVLFRKMDYNFCLLILDNLHLLKLRLSLPDNSYQRLENKLYHFIYHTSSKWSLYLPRRKNMTTLKFLARYKTKLCMFTVTYDLNKEGASHIIYLERRDFEKAMESFKKDLLNRNIEGNIRTTLTKLPNEDFNSLMLLPNLRDDYSLKKISQHVAQLYSINVKYKNKYVFLLIERTLQIVGEFLKSTDESLHLQRSTEALVKAEISVDVVNELKILRNLLCHTKNGELLKRIEVEIYTPDIFDTILEELFFVKRKIDEVIIILKPLLERDLIQNAMSMIHSRTNEMPDKVRIYFHALKVMGYMPNNFIRSKYEERFYANTWAPLGYSKLLMKEVMFLGVHAEQLDLKRYAAIKKVFRNIIQKFPFYRQNIENSLKTILTCKEKWQQIVKDLKDKTTCVNILDYPNEEDANRIKSYSKKNYFEDDSHKQLVENDGLFSTVENHWSFIECLLDFIVNQTRIFNDTLEELEWNLFTDKLKKLSEYKYNKNHTETILIEYLDLMERKLNEYKQKNKNKTYIEDRDTFPKFTGIKELTRKLLMANFLTQEEKLHVFNDTSEILSGKNKNKNSTLVEKMINKIKNDIAIPKKEYTNFVVSTKLGKKSQKILLNLVMGHKRDPLLPQCLSKRISILREITQKQSVRQLVLHYKLDKTFQVLLEVLMFDIFAILEGNKNDEIIKKSSRLLTEINLRNVLTHGSALLEVVGNVLDSSDLATELINKALNFLRDEISINALCTLCDLGFDFTDINDDTLSSEQKQLIVEFKKSPMWNDYLQLIPDYKQKIFDKRKRTPVIDEISVKLIRAVTKKEYLLVQEIITEGANVNFIDGHQKAVIHYAAMKGDIKMMDVLIKNGADVNIRHKEKNLNALHYSSMNNFIVAVEYLLENGADCVALDDKGRTPIYWAGQRNHDKVCQLLRRAMKRKIVKSD